MNPGSEGPAVATGIIVFFLLILAELAVSMRLQRPVYRLRNAVSNLATGAVHGLANAYYAASLGGYYEAFRLRFGVHDFSHMSWWSYAVLVVLVDFLFYWNHRALHKYRFMWCAHVVHHQSTDYNYTVSLRVSILQVWYAAIFGLPLALAGFPIAAVWPVFIADKFYQFWIHTRLIGPLGPLEWVLVTPQHHSVHHATNPEYVDKNFGGMFILWDKIFGTFAQRKAEPVFGIDGLLTTFDPLLANVDQWQRFWRQVRRKPAPADLPPLDAQPFLGTDESAEGARSPAEVGLVESALRLFAPVTVLLTFLYTQGPFSMEWVIAIAVAFLWLHRLGQYLDRKFLGRTLDVGVIVAGAFTAAVALFAGWIHAPLALAIAAGCVMLITETLVEPAMALGARALDALRF